MNKWYQSCTWMLVASMAIQLSGCAQQPKWLSRISNRDRDDQKLVDVEGKSKDKSKSKSAVAQKDSGSKSKSKSSGTGKSTDSQVAKKSPGKSQSSSKDSSRTEVASAKESAASRYAKSAKSPRDPFLSDEFEALESKQAIATNKLEEKSAAGRKALTNVESAASDTARIAQTSAKGNRIPDAEPVTDRTSAARIREAAHQVEDNLAELGELPEWAVSDETARAKSLAKQATQSAKSEVGRAKATASTATHKAARSAEQIQWELENTLKEPAPVSPVAKAKTKSTASSLAGLCPDAQGEVRELVRSLNVNDVEGLKRTVHKIGRIGPDAAPAAPALEYLLKHKEGLVRIHAALALTRVQQSSPSAVKAVVEGLKSTDPGIRSFAAATLAEMGPQAGEALTELANNLDDRDGYVRLHAAEVLIRYEEWSYRSLEALLGCLSDRDENVRWLATYSLAELAPESPEAVAALSKATRDPVVKVQTGAVYALGEIGPFARNAAANLHRLADETNRAELQSAIIYALQQIEQ